MVDPIKNYLEADTELTFWLVIQTMVTQGRAYRCSIYLYDSEYLLLDKAIADLATSDMEVCRVVPPRQPERYILCHLCES